jgi:hypothetical protein
MSSSWIGKNGLIVEFNILFPAEGHLYDKWGRWNEKKVKGGLLIAFKLDLQIFFFSEPLFKKNKNQW